MEHEARTTGESSGGNRDIKALLSRNVSISIPTKILYMVTRLALPPIVLNSVTLEEYGLWACSFILVSDIGLTSFGLSNVFAETATCPGLLVFDSAD